MDIATRFLINVAKGILAGYLFSAYAPGLFGKLGQAAILPLSVLVALSAVILVGTYARYFKRGPLEELLRYITRGRTQRITVLTRANGDHQ